MEYSFPQYLLAKQSVDDRALNKDVLSALKANLRPGPLTIIEVGGGIGTMLARLLRWGVIPQAEYTLVDEMAENIAFARDWLPEWAKEYGLQAKSSGGDTLEVFDEQRHVRVRLVEKDVVEFICQEPAPADLLIAHAFLDLLPMPDSLPGLLGLTKDLAWLTVNFDGVTSLEPVIDAELDARIETLYHQSMDIRPSGGDSQAGRHLFMHLNQVGAEILSAGASDWVVYPSQDRYPADEAYFLDFILHFFESSLGNHPALEAGVLTGWLQQRRAQVEQAELVYIAHQMDYLVKV
jgi:hypothetical protein